VIRFLVKEGIHPKEIPAHFGNIYGEETMKKTQVFFWVTEVRRWRNDLSDEERPGKPPTTGLDDILAHRLERDPHMMVCRLAASLRISYQTVFNNFHESLGLKYYHLRWVPHTPNDDQKAKMIWYGMI
jgi:hypothetical protein